MEITTDPVELWAGPHSRSRAEKDYFDNKFGPFYRTAQVFIKPVSKENVILKSLNSLMKKLTHFSFKHFVDYAQGCPRNFGKSLNLNPFTSKLKNKIYSFNNFNV